MGEPPKKKMKTGEDGEEAPKPELDPADRSAVVEAAIAIMTEAGAAGDKYMFGSDLSSALSDNADLEHSISKVKVSLGAKKGKGWLKNLLSTEGGSGVQEVFPGVTEPCFQMGWAALSEVSLEHGRVTPTRKEGAQAAKQQNAGKGQGKQGFGKAGAGQTNQKAKGGSADFQAGIAKGYEKGKGEAFQAGWESACAYFGFKGGGAQKGKGMWGNPMEAYMWGKGKGMWGKGAESQGKSGWGGGQTMGNAPKKAPKQAHVDKDRSQVDPEAAEKGCAEAGEEGIRLAAHAVNALGYMEPDKGEEGWVAGNTLVKELMNAMPEEVANVKQAFGKVVKNGKGWLKMLLSRESHVECATPAGCGEPCYRLAK